MSRSRSRSRSRMVMWEGPEPVRKGGKRRIFRRRGSSSNVVFIIFS